MKYLTNGVAVLVALALFSAAETTAQPMAQITIGNSPTGTVLLSYLHDKTFPEFGKAVADPIARSVCVVATNTSSRDIIGIQTLWTVVDKTGHHARHASNCDGFLTPELRPAIRAHTRILLGPQLFIPEELAKQYGRDGYFGAPSAGVVAHISSLAQSAVNIRLDVDSIIFADGEIVGPDTLHYVEDIYARSSAAGLVLQAFRSAKDRGAPLQKSLESLAAARKAKGVSAISLKHEARWSKVFADRVTKVDSPDEYLSYLEQIAVPKKLWRKDQ